MYIHADIFLDESIKDLCVEDTTVGFLTRRSGQQTLPPSNAKAQTSTSVPTSGLCFVGMLAV